jgi:peptidoglycan/xylan/chitin deacetylase (PgdA/CDA1 family)
VVTLDEGVDRLKDGTLPPCATVITFDDGFHNFYSRALAILKEFSFPATLYVTTYYVLKGTPVFRLVVQYMFWRTSRRVLDVESLNGPWTGEIVLEQTPESIRKMWEIIDYAEQEWTEDKRVDLMRKLGHELDVSYEEIKASRKLSLLTLDELAGLDTSLVSIQLHTHRHRLPVDELEVQREIEDNKECLERIAGQPCVHLCYPSGEWSQAHWPWLEAAQLQSATTCDSGLNYRYTPVFGLRRFVDSDQVAPIEFEAEICGYAPLLREIAGRNFFSAFLAPAHSKAMVRQDSAPVLRAFKRG